MEVAAIREATVALFFFCKSECAGET